MKVQFYQNDTVSFLHDTLDILLEHETQNSLLVSNAQRGNDSSYNSENWFCATVKNGSGGVTVSAMCTPPFNIVIYETGNKHDGEALNLLAKELFNAGYNPPGVTGEVVTAGMFAESYTKVSGKNKKIHSTLNAMQLFEVSKIDFAPGFMREIVEEDICVMPYWEKEFFIDCNADLWNANLNHTTESFKNDLGKNKHYIWFDKTPVSTAVFARENFNGATVSKVYTPPFFRNKGYCASLMAQLSQNLLDRGYKYCCLFADADYPVSNKVYQKIGYRDVCLYQEIKFE